LNYGELTRKLRRFGIELRRQGRGSHEIWWDPRKKLYTRISNHGSEEIKKGTLARILKDLGLTEEDLAGN
jgi:predicted RNA binding protein YcfA (HicA-like mRNA interferase family)